ncbi:hypothetical protein KP509_29G051000 [Ceratopteris richardii]|uniref:SS18 N-terminal domain-containing protein n=1 Tax=Ceratopteris richardii TaxID=49495 RepID=A0A8T2R8J3_CERRI|nr:hypothetical protein KP509_29G051000 [Ceratopteris richardii]
MQQQPPQTFTGGPHPPIASVTTELVQKYLDENKQLILSILDNQNVGNLNECAVYQQKLQSNLMFLAAVADAQTQSPPIHLQPHLRPPGMQYMPPQQAQKHMVPQTMLRPPMQYSPNDIVVMQQAKMHQQQSLPQQQLMHGQGQAGGIVYQMNPSDTPMGMNSMMMSRGYSGGGMPEGIQLNRASTVEMRLGNRVSSDAGGGQLGPNNSSVSPALGGETSQTNSKSFNEGEN